MINKSMDPSKLHACTLQPSHMNSEWTHIIHYSCERGVRYMHVT